MPLGKREKKRNKIKNCLHRWLFEHFSQSPLCPKPLGFFPLFSHSPCLLPLSSLATWLWPWDNQELWAVKTASPPGTLSVPSMHVRLRSLCKTPRPSFSPSPGPCLGTRLPRSGPSPGIKADWASGTSVPSSGNWGEEQAGAQGCSETSGRCLVHSNDAGRCRRYYSCFHCFNAPGH